MGRLLIATIVLSAALAPAVAGAQRDPRATRDYRRTIRRALGEFNAGRFEEARALFHQAHESYPNARTARGIGMASFELRDYVSAEASLNEALESQTRPLTDAQRSETEDLLAQTRSFLGRYLFILDPSTATLTVDDAEPASRLDGMVLLPVGEHVIVARAEGYETWTRRITVAGGETETVEVALVSQQTERPAPAPSGGDDGLFVAGLITLAAAGAPLVMTASGIGWVVDRDSEVATCRDVLPTQECLNGDVLASEQSAAIAFTVTTGVVTALAAGAGLTLLLLGLDGAASEEAARCAPGLGGVACAGRF